MRFSAVQLEQRDVHVEELGKTKASKKKTALVIKKQKKQIKKTHKLQDQPT